MNILEFTILIWLGSLVAGFLGGLTGLGGGVVIVPLLSLVFGVDIRYAIGASLISVIATSSGAASAYVKEGYINMRIGMFLEIATTVGALVGAGLAARLSPDAVAVIFGVVLIGSAYSASRPRSVKQRPDKPDRIAAYLKFDGAFPGPDGQGTMRSMVAYHVRGVPAGFSLMFAAGGLSGLLGIGSGALKVLAMDQAMRIPFKVSTTTSNFMIGVTAAASAGVYLNRGYIDPGLAMPVVLGVLPGAMLATVFLKSTKSGILRKIFAVVVVVLAVEMIYNGLTGRF
ncbi:MAG: sulfite exporter TauE/SafE family protein [Thermoguttaceae bacterium]|jgi:hypothetical protein